MKRSSANRGPKRWTPARRSNDCIRQSATHPRCAGVSYSKSKCGGEDHRTLTRAAILQRSITRPCWDWQCPYPARRGLRGYAWVHYRVFQVDPSVHIAISTAVIRRPRPSEFPTREFISQGVFGRSCFRATPAWSTRSRRGVNVRDALRAVYLTEATEPEHCRRVQIVVGKLPGLPDRTWAFGPWRSS